MTLRSLSIVEYFPVCAAAETILTPMFPAQSLLTASTSPTLCEVFLPLFGFFRPACQNAGGASFEFYPFGRVSRPATHRLRLRGCMLILVPLVPHFFKQADRLVDDHFSSPRHKGRTDSVGLQKQHVRDVIAPEE